MGSISEKGKSWVAEVCIDRKRQSKSFPSLDAAEAWVALKEGRVRVSPIVGKALSSTQLTKEEIVGNALPYAKISGIYFLIKGKDIVYIGRSEHMMRRIGVHCVRNVDFDSYYFIICESSRADVLEPYYIKLFEPILNIQFSNDRLKITPRQSVM